MNNLAWSLGRYQMLALSVAALLQRSPVVRIMNFVDTLARTPLNRALQLAATALAIAETQHAVTGATTFSTVPATPASAKTGEQFDMAFAVTGAPSAVGSWKVQGTLPPGLEIPGLNGSVLNARVGKITGTPTTVGNYRITVQAYSKTNNSGDTNKKAYPIDIAVTAGVAPPPVTVFTASPSPQSQVEAGQPLTLTFSVTGMTAASWEIIGSAPAGMSLTGPNGETPQNGTLNAVSGKISGAPTTLGVYDFTAQPYDQINRGGVTDGVQHAFTISVVAPAFAGPLEEWKFSQLGSIDAPNGGDPDRDGAPNLLEYALGRDPNSPDSALGIRQSTHTNATGQCLRIELNRLPGRNDIDIIVEAATTPTGPWVAIATSSRGNAFSGTATIEETAQTGDTVLVRISDAHSAAESGGLRFIRVRIAP